MARILPKINSSLKEFIEAQQMFFVATADVDGRINLSPKGLDSLKVLSPNQLIWLNLTGSGNETAAHLLALNRMTIMFCSYEGNPLILRLYGKARTIHPGEEGWDDLYKHFPKMPGARQIFDMTVETVQTSCGYAVPLMDFKEERSILKSWAEKQGKDKIRTYWKDKNARSLDGLDTGIVED